MYGTYITAFTIRIVQLKAQCTINIVDRSIVRKAKEPRWFSKAKPRWFFIKHDQHSTPIWQYVWDACSREQNFRTAIRNYVFSYLHNLTHAHIFNLCHFNFKFSSAPMPIVKTLKDRSISMYHLISYTLN